MKRIIIAAIALAAAVGAFAQTVEIVSPTAWTLYRGTTIVQPRVTHATEGACIAAAPTGVQHNCRATVTFIKRAAPVTPDPTPPTVPEPAPGSWSMIAGEGGSFTANGTVRFGSGSAWVSRRVDGAGQCTVAFFGRDPAQGVWKWCELAGSAAPTPEPPAPAPEPTPVPTPTPTPTPDPVPSGTVLHFSDCQAGAAAGCVAGNNANAGTLAAPKRDLTGLNIGSLAAGTTLRFARGGAWNASRISLENTRSSAASPITFEAYGTGEKPILSTASGVGFQVGGGWGNTTNDGGYVLRGLHLRGTGSDDSHWGVWLVQNVRDVLLEDVTLTGWTIAIHSSAGSPHGVRGVTVRGGEVSRNRSMGILGGYTDSVFEGTVYRENNFSGSNRDHAMYLSTGTNITVRGNRFVDNSVVSGRCTGGNFTIHGVVDGLLVENNEIEVPAADFACGGFNITAGYDYAESFRNVVVRGNTGINLGQCLVCINSAPGALIEGNRAFTRSANPMGLTLANGFMASETPMTGVTVRDNTLCGQGSVTNIAGAATAGNAVRTGADASTGACAR